MNKKSNEDVENIHKKDDNESQEQSSGVSDVPDTSMSTLILWNISKVLEQNPNINLKSALQAAQKQLESSFDVNAIISQEPGQRHLACALLAWQQLGHRDGDSLYRFVETKKNGQVYSQKMSSEDFLMKQINSIGEKASMIPKVTESRSFDASSLIGPVVKLPLETKIVMRVDNVQSSRASAKSSKKENDIMNRIEEACCLEAGCVEKLSALDTSTKELATRAAKLARREADRAELLERAEAAWKDLELGYQRRLVQSQEKEEDLARQTRLLMEERNNNKSVCTTLMRELKQYGDQAETDRLRLSKIEKEVCDKACERLRLSEASARQDSQLAEQQCKAQQQDRDYQFQEEQARRKMLSLESEVECTRALLIETERAIRAELSALREQVSQVSKELIKEDAHGIAIKGEIELLQKEKQEIMEDLEGCKMVCDKRMEAKMEELKKKRETLKELKAKVIECRCRLPMDTAVEVKRTASLAALCRCKPDDKILDSCSCTSLRSSLLSNLLSDLFSGLQDELGAVGPTMPCQLLKCLEDRHNWDRTSVVKTNLRNFFSKLLMGELDIAIATSIEKYHAKWVGASCADAARPIPDMGGPENEGWQQRALERRAQKLASELAEQMFQEQADKLLKRAQDIVSKGPPPCECRPPPTALYPCLVEPQVIGGGVSSGRLQGTISVREVEISNNPERCLNNAQDANPATKIAGAVVTTVTKTVGSRGRVLIESHCSGVTTPSYWRRTLDDVTQLKTQIEDLKKDSINKDDLKIMEKNITKIIERVSGSTPGNKDERKEIRNRRILPSDSYNMNNKINTSKKKQTEGNARMLNKSSYQNEKPLGKVYKRPPQSYAVNLCLCGTQKYPTKLSNEEKFVNPASKEAESQSSNIKQSKPIVKLSPQDSKYSKQITQEACRSDCVCLNKAPSNTSIDKLLETLTKWKCDLVNSQDSECKKENVKSSSPIIIGGSIENSSKRSIKSHENLSEEIKPIESQATKLTKPKKSPEPLIITKNISISNIRTDLDHSTMPTTNSEYVGAVNLDKSDENICNQFEHKLDRSNVIKITCDNCKKCLDIENEQNQMDFQKNEKQIRTKNLNDSIKEKKCELPSWLNQAKKAESKGDLNKSHECNPKEILMNTNNIFCKNSANLTAYSANLDENGAFHLETGSNKKDCRNSSSIDHIIMASDLFEYDCDYRIKFLGVTLANPTTDKKIENISKVDFKNVNRKNINMSKVGKLGKIENKNSSEHIYKVGDVIKNTTYDNDCCTNKREKDDCHAKQYWTNFSQCDNIEKLLSHESKQNDDNISRQLPTCQCNVQFHEIKNLFHNAVNKQQYGDFISNQTKGLDTQSFEEIKDKPEACVCCFTYDKEESNNLEVNTFHLLEEHLKERLIEFKANCESSNVSPDEEDKMFSTLLQNIKQVISNSTNKIMCKCSDENQTKGSWNRAYILLQEYLKTKIDRLQCKCLSPNISSKEKLIPAVTNEVCRLIEKDFQRLKDIYRSQNKDKISKDQISAETPEKDINKNIQNIKNENSHNVSAQVSAINKIDTEPCNVLKKDNQHIQTELVKKVDKCYSSDPMNVEKKVVFNTPKITRNVNDNSNISLLAQSLDFNQKLELKEEDILNNTDIMNNTNNVLPFKAKMSPEVSCDPKLDVVNRNDNKNLTMPSLAQNSPYTGKLDTIIDDVHQQEITEDSKYIDSINKDDTSKETSFLPLIGHTLSCTCDLRLGSCVCSKSMVQANNATINNIWKQFTSNKTEPQKMSYMMNNVCKTYDNINHVAISNDTSYAYNNAKIDSLESKNKNLCDSETSAQGEDDMTLKISLNGSSKVHMNNATDTNDENVMSLEPVSSNYDSSVWYECSSQTTQEQHNARLTCIHCKDKGAKRVRSETLLQLQNKKMKHTKVPQDCDCSMVPLCHVKMLINNIENKLSCLECTCDSLSSSVCPIHSKRNMS